MYFRVFAFWRFLAAILIMTYHFLFWGPEGARAYADLLHNLLPLLDMFFMISGFFITMRYADRLATPREFGSFFRRRVARLYPLHLITTLFFLLAAIFAWSIDARHYPYGVEFAALPYHLLAIHALGFTDTLALNYVSWSVSAEFFAYAMFPLIVIVLRRGGTLGLAGFLALVLAALEVASYRGVFPNGHWTLADNFGAYRAFADFTLGALIARMVATPRFSLSSPWPGIALMAIALPMMLAEAPWYLTLPMLAASLYASALAETRNPASTEALAFMMPVTAASFGIYLWHPVLEFFFLRVLWDRWLEGTGAVDFYLFMLVPMLASILVAFASFRYLEPRLAAFMIGPRPAGTPRREAVTKS